ncbi:hypothetical protein DERF_008204 [Dermatophagoides farinae]|uniref:Uncharacterized protein n=1 Tax=Dermatophagoides farinae TaxID=6954 RepID=A0A922I137_DERFA|nr:hypothetical protein DERF_008204 [Dermatophagoides farinae]
MTTFSDNFCPPLDSEVVAAIISSRDGFSLNTSRSNPVRTPSSAVAEEFMAESSGSRLVNM